MLMIRQLFLLAALGSDGGYVSSSDIAEYLGEVDSRFWGRGCLKRFDSGIWKNLRHMEQRGWVTSAVRRGRGHAGRNRYWSVTADGLREVHRVHEALSHIIAA